MNRALFNDHYFICKVLAISSLVIALLFCSALVSARNLQVLLVPESASTLFGQKETLPKSYPALEKGLTFSLSRSLEVLIDKQRVFPDCSLYLCGEHDIYALMQKVNEKVPEVNLVVLYSFGDELGSTLYVRLLDPLSYRVRFTDNLSLIDEQSVASLQILGQNMGKLIEASLSEMQPQSEYSLSLDGFLANELNGLPAWILANSGNSQLVLTQTNIDYQLFNKYFAISNNQYTLLTTLNASQLKQLLGEFFEQQMLNSTIYFNNKNIQNEQFTVIREGNPYASTLISSVTLIIVFMLLLSLFIRRQYLNSRLCEYGEKRNADGWLLTYEKSSFLLYGLKKKWVSQVPLWTRLQNESSDLANKAKLYFEAGDVHTAKLFLSKSLHANTANSQANTLIKAIEASQANEKSLSENEQWIRNKLAKAMKNYRQKQVVKALRPLYQALEVAKEEPSLKKQASAINKLIEKTKQEFSTNVQALVVNCSSDPQRLVLCQNETIHLGRQSNNDDLAWFSTQDSVFYINQKSVSRAGQQSFIKRQESGFFLVDSNSKNGTFINRNRLIPYQPTRLNNADIIHIGGNTPFLSAALKVKLKPNESLLELSIDLQSMALIDKQELDSVWPDNSIALRSRLVCMVQECCLALNKNTHELQVFEIDELPLINQASNKQNADEDLNESSNSLLWQPLCIIKLGNNASVRPFAPLCKNNEIKLDSKSLLGEVPLIFPCSLSYSNINIQLTAYDSTSVRRTHGPLVTATTRAGKQ
jgi:hypothetical protein